MTPKLPGPRPDRVVLLFVSPLPPIRAKSTPAAQFDVLGRLAIHTRIGMPCTPDGGVQLFMLERAKGLAVLLYSMVHLRRCRLVVIAALPASHRLLALELLSGGGVTVNSRVAALLHHEYTGVTKIYLAFQGYTLS